VLRTCDLIQGMGRKYTANEDVQLSAVSAMHRTITFAKQTLFPNLPLVLCVLVSFAPLHLLLSYYRDARGTDNTRAQLELGPVTFQL